MLTPRIRQTVSCTLACTLAGVVLLVLLGHRPLAEWDEGIYAEVAREMLSSGAWHGSWLTPHWNYQLWMEKPPLLMWLTAAVYRMFGVSEFTARAVSAFAGIALVGLTHAWVLKRFNEMSAWFATLALLASFGFQHASRTGETDVLLSLCLFVALIGVVRIRSAEWGGGLLFWTGFAMAFMTKGAASLVLLPAVLAVTVANRSDDVRLTRKAKAELLCGAGLFLVITVPWHAWMWFHFRWDFVHTYISWQVMDRAQHPIEGHITHFWYYVSVLFVSVPLISLAYVPALVAVWRDKRLQALRPFAVFALVELGAFSLARTRLPHYICPVYAPLSALTGVWAARLARELSAARGGPAYRRPAVRATTACTLFVVFVTMTAGARKALHSPKLADGSIAPDSRESAKLLKSFFGTPGDTSEVRPLLIWRAGRFVPIASEIFYSRGPALQVSLRGQAPGSRVDRYADNPSPIERAVGLQPHALLIEKPLLQQLPPDLEFLPVSAGTSLDLGIVRPVHPPS